MQRTTETRFEVRVPVDDAGAQWVAVRVETLTGVVASGSNGVVAGYAREFALADPDDDLAEAIALATGGRVDAAAADAFDLAPSRGSAAWEMWPLLAAIALALFFSDIVLRQVIVSKGDVALWREAVRPAAKQPVEALVTEPLPLRRPGIPDDAPGPSPETPSAPEGRREMLPEEETLSRLLRRKRRR